MQYKSLSRVMFWFIPAAVAVFSSSALCNPAILKAPAETPPTRIQAHYGISLNGFDLGSLDFAAETAATGYKVTSDVNISALFGAFTWRGVTNSSGIISQSAFKPRDYRFEYTSTTSNGSVEMGFDGKAVNRLAVEPLAHSAPDTVPLERSHLAGVIDPLSAIMTLTRTDAAKPCGKKLAIFDGKQRFDLSLSFVRQEPTADGHLAQATVCRIKYTPIAGYRNNDETRALAQNTGIEISFRPIPAARLMVPHKVVIPTMAGDAVLSAEHIKISTPDRDKIAAASD